MPPLPHLSLGSVEIGFPVVQAALAGVSDWPARVIARRMGAAYTVAEVLLDKFVLNVTKGSKAKRHIRVTDEEHPCGAQLMGDTPEQFPPAARKLVEFGFDVIDLNFACPVKKVVGKCRGGFLLSRPATALEIVARVRDALPPQVPLTVKLRRGLDDSEESRERFYEIFDGVFRLGAAAVTLHGRTVRQRYEGRSSWDFLSEVRRRAPGRTILGSGDLWTAQDCLDMLSQTGMSGASVARGAIGNPWIFSQVRALAAGQPAGPPSIDQQREVMLEHYRLAEAMYGPKWVVGRMQAAGIKYSRLHPEAEKVRDAFVAARTAAQWHSVLDTWYRGR
jgi:tRNA-dihydrouridine synthase B